MLRAVVLIIVSTSIASTTQIEASFMDMQNKCHRADFRIFIDVGHSESEPGAISARGVGEYQFNFRLAKEVVDALISADFEKTIMYVSPDSSRSQLLQRANEANKLPADLFISMHHDSVPSRFKKKWIHEGVEQEYSDHFTGHSIFVSSGNQDYSGSLHFGSLLGEEMNARGFKYATQYRESFMGAHRRQLVDSKSGVYKYDELVVLKSTKMPAVLFEAGSIIHREEELKMSDPEYRVKIVSAIVEAVAKFCTNRTGRR